MLTTQLMAIPHKEVQLNYPRIKNFKKNNQRAEIGKIIFVVIVSRLRLIQSSGC